jgi:(5-formylfuran-3-yl)methyl phosphate transaminase
MTAERMKQISPFIVMEVMERAAEMERRGLPVIHLEVGEPDFDLPGCVSDALHRACTQGKSHYTHSLGDPELREEIAKKYVLEYGVHIDPGQIVVTSGSSPAILLALGVLCDQGDEVILSDPGYSCYPNFLRFLGIKAVRVSVHEEDGFQYRPEEIGRHISKKTRAILINSPMNPTGNLLSPEVMKQLTTLGIPVISDEIYHGLVYEGRAHSMLEFTEDTFIINGFSKLYAMTGLRLGYAIVPVEIARTIQKLQQNLFICAGSAVQQAGIAALRSAQDDILYMKETYNKRRIYIVDRLRKMGFNIRVVPTGAFYVFVNARHLSSNSFHLAFDILEKAHVGVTPGIDFGRNGEGFLRFSYANSIENIEEGMNRLEKYLKNQSRL